MSRQWTLLAALSVVAALAASVPNAADPASPGISCRSPRVALMAPLTGDAASIGLEQRNWAHYAVATFTRSHPRMRVRLVELDTALDQSAASTQAWSLVSDRRVAGVVGPAVSSEVLAVGPAFRRAGLAFVSGSATLPDLTLAKERVPTFFRVVPHDGVQAATVARYVHRVLHARRVTVVDDRTPGGIQLASAIVRRLRAARVQVTRELLPVDQADFAPAIARIQRSATHLVVLPWQQPARAQAFGSQLRAQGIDTPILATDGSFSPTQFTLDRAYVSWFAPDIRAIPSARKYVNGYRRMFDARFGTFGPPVFAATQVLLTALAKACRDDRATRSEVVTWVRRTFIPRSILGTPLAFTKTGDLRGARFRIFRVVRGEYAMIW